jgi:hypothetical protein
MTTRARVPTAPEPWLAAAIVALVGVRVFVAVLLVASPPTDDPWIERAETIARSPATPYLHFPLALMPAEGATVRALGGAGDEATATRVAILAFAADLAAAAAVARGWGRRAAATYLVLGLPLLAIAYLRLDLVAVALAAWAAATFRERRDGPFAVLLGLAVWWKLWPIVLAPAAWVGRRRAALIPAAAVVLIGGAAWFLWGGRDGPVQVLTSRGAVGWAVDGTVGSVVRLLTGDAAIPEAGALRVGAIPLWARAASFVALVAVELAIWRDAARDPDREPFGATAVASIAALLALAPVSPTLAAAWVVPFAAVAMASDREERRVGVLATGAIVLSGLLTLRGPDAQSTVLTLVALARNLLWIGVVASWLTRPISRRAFAR